jgi:FMN phosphatase YigB (HAD superfamily)
MSLPLETTGSGPIRLVTFDLYDTLIEMDPSRWVRLQNAANRLQMSTDLDVLRVADRVAEDFYTEENGARPIRDRSVEEREQFRLDHLARWLDAAGIRYDDGILKQLRQAYVDEFTAEATETNYRVFADVAPALLKLEDAGIKRAIISNADADVTELCTHLNFAHHMDAIITSALVGWEKPNPRTFYAALDHPLIDVAPADAIHIGDQPGSDVAGAVAIGMRAALIDRYDRHTDDEHPAIRVGSLPELADLVIAHNQQS